MNWINSLKESAKHRIGDDVRMIEKSLAHFNDHETWQKPNSELNSMANLLLHLSGNIRQYIISSLGSVDDNRQRDLEFSQDKNSTKEAALKQFTDTVDEAIQVIDKCTESELMQKCVVQGFELDGIGIIVHVVEHLSYHTGQIAFWVKYKKEKDLNFFEGHDLNSLNR